MAVVVSKHAERPKSKTSLPVDQSSSPIGGMSDEEVLAFISSFVGVHDSQRPLSIANFFQPRSVYMDYGEVYLDFMQKDSDKHRAGWPIRHYKLVSSIKLARNEEPGISGVQLPDSVCR